MIVITTRSSLWLGDDHLLCVETTGYTENYRRFFFRDIQAITLHKTNTYLIAISILIPLTLLFVFLAIIAVDPVGSAINGGIALLPGIPMVVSLVRGPSCRCRIRTALQEDDIPALANIRKARAVIQRIRARIEEVQGAQPREELPARILQLATESRPHLVVDNPSLPPRMIG
jgi:hypothetical protein